MDQPRRRHQPLLHLVREHPAENQAEDRPCPWVPGLMNLMKMICIQSTIIGVDRIFRIIQRKQ